VRDYHLCLNFSIIKEKIIQNLFVVFYSVLYLSQIKNLFGKGKEKGLEF